MDIVDNTRFIEPFAVDLDLEEGIMHDADNHIIRRASDMRGYCADEEALERFVAQQNDPRHYEVFQVPVPKQAGHLMYCISTLQPGVIGQKCYMTKGHYHEKIHTGEIYLGLRGEGHIMLKNQDGAWQTEPILRGRMVYVTPYWAHRSINIGTEELLLSFCVYPAECGYNYGDIQTWGFPKRVFKTTAKSNFDSQDSETVA